MMLLFIFFSQQVGAQTPVLSMTNFYTGKTISIQTAKKVKLITNDNQIYKGKLIVVDSTTLAVDSNHISIEHVYSLKIPRPRLTDLGNFCLVGGGCLTSVGTSYAVIDLNQGGPSEVIYYFMGACFAGAQSIAIGIILRNIQKQYKAEDYIFSISKVDDRYVN